MLKPIVTASHFCRAFMSSFDKGRDSLMPAHPSAKFSALTPRVRETIVWSSHAGGYVRLEFANDGPANEGGGSSAKGDAYNRTGNIRIVKRNVGKAGKEIWRVMDGSKQLVQVSQQQFGDNIEDIANELLSMAKAGKSKEELKEKKERVMVNLQKLHAKRGETPA